MVAYIGIKVLEEAYNCKNCPDLKTHLEVCTLKAIKPIKQIKPKKKLKIKDFAGRWRNKTQRP
jgi:hypothetical protein